MKQNIKLLSSILLVTMILSACASAEVPAAPTNTPATSKQIQVTEADQGKNIMLKAGDKLVITLESNPSTGYTWEVKPVDHALLTLTGKSTFKADSDKLGAPGKTNLNFQAVASGSQSLSLLYQRSFEKGVQPVKTFMINVTVY